MNITYDKDKLKELVDKAAKQIDDGGLVNELKNITKAVSVDLQQMEEFINEKREELEKINEKLNNDEIGKIISDMKGAISK